MRINQSKPGTGCIARIFRPHCTKSRRCRVATSTVRAGFPSPADDYLEEDLELNDLVKDPASTFFIRVAGDSMNGAGIREGDLLVVDRTLEPHDGDIVIAVLNGDFVLKRLQFLKGKIHLQPASPKFKPIPVTPDMEFSVWGVALHVIHTFRK